MISLRELNAHLYPTTKEIDDNLNTLLSRLNIIRAAWNKPMIVTSGLRTQADQMRINPKAPNSCHVKGAAADIYDPKGELQAWLLANVPLLEQAGLWCEDFKATGTWIHFQIFAPRSGKRFFIP